MMIILRRIKNLIKAANVMNNLFSIKLLSKGHQTLLQILLIYLFAAFAFSANNPMYIGSFFIILL